VAILDGTQLNFQDPQAQLVPTEGPKGIPILLNFSSSAQYTLDLTLQVDQKKISMVQTVYVDASSATDDLSITINGTNQVVIAKAGTQGYYQLLVPYPPRFTFDNSSGSDLIPIILLNVPIPGVVWSAT
jgi:hypothetical protein